MGISPVLWQFLVKWLHNSALFPAEASTIAPWMDALYFFLLGMTLTGLFLVGALVFGFSIRYRKEKNPVATQNEGSTLLEATWTIIPLAIFLLTFVWGALLYFRIYDPPANAMNIYVVCKQWMWKAEHPGGQHEIAWLCRLETGEHRHGRVTANGAAEFALPLPAGLPLGYHRLDLDAGGTAAALTLIVTPQACHLPAALGPGRRSWGVACQLYGLRS